MEMIPLSHYACPTPLMADSGIQYLNFRLEESAVHSYQGFFVRKTSNGPLLRLEPQPDSSIYILPADGQTPSEIVKPEIILNGLDSLALFEGIWLPAPLLRDSPAAHAQHGPENWARIMFNRVTQQDEGVVQWRVTLAIDTQLAPSSQQPVYLAPTEQDVANGQLFALAWDNSRMAHFLDCGWIDGWLREVFIDQSAQLDDHKQNNLQMALKRFDYQGHYLNLLHLLGVYIHPPKIKLAPRADLSNSVGVDLLLDLGSSHNCALLIEQHPNLRTREQAIKPLQLRCLSKPYQQCQAIFSDRLEFNLATWGKDYFSQQSGRQTAFGWPSIVRIGEEADLLAGASRVQAGPSGLYHAQRYLCEDTPRRHPWYFNQTANSQHFAPLAIGQPLMCLIDDLGEPLADLPADKRIPVLHPYYSPAALVSQVIMEILLHSLQQINSIEWRISHGQLESTRYLRRIQVITPSSMTCLERRRLRLRIDQAITLLWQSSETAGPRLKLTAKPSIFCHWDDTSCMQIDWLYRQSLVTHKTHIEDLFKRLSSQPDVGYSSSPRQLRIAGFNLGDTSMNLAIIQYRLVLDQNHNLTLTPTRLADESVTLGKDSLLLNILQNSLLPAISQALQAEGIADAEQKVYATFHSSGTCLASADGRRQMVQQCLIPAAKFLLSYGLKCLAEEQNIPLDTTLSRLLGHRASQVMDDRPKAFTGLEGMVDDLSGLLRLPLKIDVQNLTQSLVDGEQPLNRAVQLFCQLINQSSCDIVLVSGIDPHHTRIKQLLLDSCTLPNTQYHWLDNEDSLMGTPSNKPIGAAIKSSTRGGLILQQAAQLRLTHFNINMKQLALTPRAGFFGIMNDNGFLREDSLWYFNPADKQQTADWITLPPFWLNANSCFGFRSQAHQHWPARPLFTLTILDTELAETIALGETLQVTLQVSNDGAEYQLSQIQLGNGLPISDPWRFIRLVPHSSGGASSEDDWQENGSLL